MTFANHAQRDPARALDDLHRSFTHEYSPATPSEAALVLQLAMSTLRIQTLIPRALTDPKLDKELLKLEDHFQKTLRLLLRVQNLRKKSQPKTPAPKPAITHAAAATEAPQTQSRPVQPPTRAA